jgi:hypothetical protein
VQSHQINTNSIKYENILTVKQKFDTSRRNLISKKNPKANILFQIKLYKTNIPIRLAISNTEFLDLRS